MLELSLRAHVPIVTSRYDQLLSILAGLSAMQPQPVLEKHLIFKPSKKQEEKSLAKGGSQEVRVLKKNTASKEEGEVHYRSLVGSKAPIAHRGGGLKESVGEPMQVDADEELQVEGSEVKDGAEVNGGRPHEDGDDNTTWSLVFKALPEPSQPVTSRAIEQQTITASDPLKAMEEMSQSFVTSFYLSGHRFTNHNLNIVVYRIHVDSAATNHNDLLTITDGADEKKRLLDPSGAFMLEASLTMEETASSDSQKKLKDRGVKELQALKETLRGVVDLEAGDRLAMDSRVK